MGMGWDHGSGRGRPPQALVNRPLAVARAVVLSGEAGPGVAHYE